MSVFCFATAPWVVATLFFTLLGYAAIFALPAIAAVLIFVL